MKGDQKLLFWVLLLSALIFAVDILIPLGIAVGVFYVLALALLFKSESTKSVIWVGVLGVALTILAYLIQYTDETTYYSGVNRIISVVAIVVMAFVVFKSKSDRNDVLNRLRSTNRFFKDTQRVAHIGVWKVNFQNNISVWTSEAYEIFDFNKSRPITSKDLLNYIHPDYRGSVLRRIEESKSKGKKWDIEVLINTDKNIKKWIRLVGYPVYENDEVVEIRGLMIDINDTKTKELELKQTHHEVLSYQAKLLNSQINPHFMFNALNAIQYYILDQNTESAINYISEFSQLMRTVLNNSAKEFISIDEEVNWLTRYLNLERLRFSDKFDFTIDIDEEIDEEEDMIPTMLVQPFVENSIIHGIGPLEANGQINISFKYLNENIQCVIEDNGVGRDRAAVLKKNRVGGKHRSQGMEITRSRIKLLSELLEGRFEYKITDKCDESGKSTGTRVDIFFKVM